MKLTRYLDYVVDSFRQAEILPECEEDICPTSTTKERFLALIGMVNALMFALLCIATIVAVAVGDRMSALLFCIFAFVFLIGVCRVDDWFKLNVATSSANESEE